MAQTQKNVKARAIIQFADNSRPVESGSLSITCSSKSEEWGNMEDVIAVDGDEIEVNLDVKRLREDLE
jgi:hypothetical protein